MSKRRNTRRLGTLSALIAMAALLLASASSAGAAIGPRWQIVSLSDTTAPAPGTLTYSVQAKNVGDTATDGSPVSIEVELPAGIQAESATLKQPEETFNDYPCVVGAQSVVCTFEEELQSPLTGPGAALRLILTAEVEASATGTLLAEMEVSGGGAPSASTVDPVTISATPPPFGIDAFDMRIDADEAGATLTQAGGHPYEVTTEIDFNTLTSPKPLEGKQWPVEPLKDALVDLPPGFLGNPTIAEPCSAEDLFGSGGLANITFCPPEAQVGTAFLRIQAERNTPPVVTADHFQPVPVFNMEPSPGVPARFAFMVLGVVTYLDAELRSDGDYGLSVNTRNISQAIGLAGTRVTFWGVPAASGYDERRERACPDENPPSEGGPACASNAAEKALLRMPTSCTGPSEGLPLSLGLDSWVDPGDFDTRTIQTHEAPGYPYPQSMWGPEVGVDGCEAVPVEGSLEAKPSARDAETSSGLSVHVKVPNPGLEDPDEIASSDLKKVKVALPQGITVNPSQAEGLGVCTPAQYESTELSFHPTDKGCPDDSKIGSVEVKTPLLEETIPGAVYIAQQDDPATSAPGAENPFDSLLALYIVLAEPQRGILIKLPGKVELEDPAHPGQIVTTFDDLPQLPFSTFDFKFREGARAPLVTPPACGKYTTETEIWGHSDPDGPPVVSESSFAIDRGIGGGPCPPGGVPGFEPGFSAGSVNPTGGAYSPFVLRLTRRDGEQNLTKFNSILPPGVSAKIAGVEKCSDAAIAASQAAGRSGRQELASPSCPANSQIGRSLAGAGVGSVLTYVPGKIYLAGPYNGAPLSVVAITPAVAGPFDVGVVVVRQALTLDPITAEVHVDGDRSDPIPHILKGIPLKLRDLRVYVDRDKFTINPTSCDPDQVQATLFGSFLDVFSPADDRSVDRASRFQAASCASLGFKPSLKLNLKGGNKRGGHPALRAVFKPRPGDANLARTVVKLPRSAFLDQAHIRTICTRVQFAADACPRGAVYGKVTAFSPLLDEPLKGPAYLRSSDNKLPDLVFDLHGVVDIETSARIDSIQGGIRATFPFVPDAPLSKVVVEMQGGKKGLIQNSRNLCAGKPTRADVKLDGHNGKARDFRPPLRPDCGGKAGGKRRR